MTMNEAIEKLMTAIKDDYRAHMGSDWHRYVSIERFEDGLTFKEGRKYIKIIERGSAWGFIVKGEDEKFKAGDILKSASWATPARNAARGNVFEDYTIQWTGPLYLK